MREIKFRVWDKKEQIMYQPNDTYRKVKLPGEDYNEKNVKYMQYTGLKDKNGVEIYEGDIVVVHRKWRSGNYIEKPYKGIIIWDKDTASFGLQDLSIDRVEFLQPIEYEIVGNIYENKELLEREDD